MIDIHCHILPEVDDGPKSWEVCQAMCGMAASDGIEHMVATPHANDRYHYDREYLRGIRDELQRRVGAVPRIGLGCDFHLSYENLQDVFVRPERYCIEDTSYLLVELSNYSIPAHVNDCFAQFSQKGITPILTHPERNPLLQQSPEQVLEWVVQGCVVQVTASAITGSWGEKALKSAKWLMDRNAVHVLASDAHDIEHRKPLLSAARDAAGRMFGHDVAHALVENNPRAIVRGEALPYLPEVNKKR